MKYRQILFRQPHADEMVRAILDGRKTQTRRPVKLPLKDPMFGCEIAGCEINGLLKDGYSLGPFGTVGDRLWVRETYAWVHPGMLQSLDPDPNSDQWGAIYKADNEMTPWSQRMVECAGWRPSIHMKREHSRIDLEITRVWVERVQDITEGDAKKEGIQSVEVGDFYGWKNYQFKTAHPRHGSIITDEEHRIHAYQSPVVSFKSLWQSIYGNRPTLPKNPESKRYHRVKRWLDNNPPTGWDANPWVWAYEFRRVKP